MPAQNWLLRTGFSLLFASGCIVTEPDITYVVPIRDASLTLGRDGAGGSRSSTVDGSGGLAGGWGGGGGSMEPGGAGGIGMGGIGGMGMGGAGTGGGKSGAGGAGGAADAGRDANGASGDADLGVDARIDAGAPGDAGTGGTGSDADGRTGTGGAGGSTGGAGGSTGGSGGSSGGSGGSSGGSGGSSGGSGGSSGGTGGTGASGKGGASVDGGGPDAPADGASGTITEFTIPTPNAGAYDIARGGDGNLWFTEETGNKVGRITTGGAITEYSLPTANARPRGLTAAGTRIYFTEFGANKIGYLETSNPSVITEVPCLAGPTGMMKADDGAVWYTAVGANEIAKLAADGTTAGHWLASAGVGGPILFTYSQVWFATTTQTRVGTFNPLNNTIQSPLGGGDAGAESLVDIIVDWNDEIWFIDGTRSNSYPSSVTFTAPGTMRSVALGPTPQLLNQYITMPSANMILVKATNNTFKTYGVPTANSTPHDIVDAPDKNVWFTEKTGNKIGRMVP